MPENLYEWIWWFLSAIILTIVLNVFSDYIKPKIDFFWQKYSDKQRAKNVEEEQKINNIVNNMLQDSRELYHVCSMLTYWQIRRSANFIMVFLVILLNLIVLTALDITNIKLPQISTLTLNPF